MNRLHGIACLKVYDERGQEVRDRLAALIYHDDRKAQNILSNAGVSSRGESEEPAVFRQQFQLELGTDRVDGERHQAQIRAIDALKVNERPLAGNLDRGEMALAFEARDPAREMEKPRVLALHGTEIVTYQRERAEPFHSEQEWRIQEEVLNAVLQTTERAISLHIGIYLSYAADPQVPWSS